jgi:hypothetical protein
MVTISFPSVAGAALAVVFAVVPALAAPGTQPAQTQTPASQSGQSAPRPEDEQRAPTLSEEPDPVSVVVGILVIAFLAFAVVGMPAFLVVVAFALGRWSARGEARAFIAASRGAAPLPVAPPVVPLQVAAPAAYDRAPYPSHSAILPNDTARLRPVSATGSR